jgi:hypothetical protein
MTGPRDSPCFWYGPPQEEHTESSIYALAVYTQPSVCPLIGAFHERYG